MLTIKLSEQFSRGIANGMTYPGICKKCGKPIKVVKGKGKSSPVLLCRKCQRS